ncbi:solute carrier family 26 protein [Nodosilinea sp. LEGE 07088]|uniref:SulP family inorganic anion transporter n=1 Tax=Nodosilinea sp. LEGE 07088 TaxID=2777968 RepID=UPI00188218F6|nr:solute carrier family 26 protein [Nodosilinea sp. LEGE 07088]MBE9140333.1 solute carrier family 26 protein [Nodosilinea sp. LEGE 07088]
MLPEKPKPSYRSAHSRQRALYSYLPFLRWLLHYQRQDLPGDVLAGAIAAIMLVPQSMAYALLAGLPPQVGLYASIAPLILYALLGTSRTLSVGPVATVSLLVATGVGKLAQPGSADYIAYALALALLVGLIQVGMGIVRLGFLANYLSHAVISGFTSAAALIIGFGQLKHLLGLSLPPTESFLGLLGAIAPRLSETNPITLGIGLSGIAILLYGNTRLGSQLERWGVAPSWVTPVTRSSPLFVVLVGTLLVWWLRLDQVADVNIVGAVPSGMPPITLPPVNWTLWQQLVPAALAISFVGFVESVAVGKSLASKRRQTIDANQELIGLGAANLGAAVTGGFPVTGGLSRSIVNFQAGANTGLASIITALLILLVVLFLTPLFYYLPQALLASTILVAVLGLLDWATLRLMWRYNKTDAASLLVTFFAVLAIGIEVGILVGIAASVILYLWRTSQPHIAVVGRVGNSEHFRNVRRHEVTTYPHLLIVRIDESLYFANTQYLETQLRAAIATRPEITTLLLMGSGINFIDASALESLERLIIDFKDAGVECYLSEIKGPVMDRLTRVGFIEHLGPNHIFLSTHQAVKALAEGGDRPET